MSKLYTVVVGMLIMAFAGCDNATFFAAAPDNLFTTPVTANGTVLESAIIDTGGGFDLMLSDHVGSGLDIIDSVDILAFNGVLTANIAEPFPYSVGDFEAVADQAFVDLGLCNCNALGFFFFRKTGAVLEINFLDGHASFLDAAPGGRAAIPFADPPVTLPEFDTSFMTVQVAGNDGTLVTVNALVDTGSNITSLRRGVLIASPTLDGTHAEILITRAELGTVHARVTLFDSPGIPDLVIGTDVMAAWSDEWYFEYDTRGGTIYADPRDDAMPPAAAGSDTPTALRLRPLARLSR